MGIDEWMNGLTQLESSLNQLTDGTQFMDTTDQQIVSLYGDKIAKTITRMNELGDDYRGNRRGPAAPQGDQPQEQHPDQPQQPQQPASRVTPSVPPGRRR